MSPTLYIEGAKSKNSLNIPTESLAVLFALKCFGNVEFNLKINCNSVNINKHSLRFGTLDWELLEVDDPNISCPSIVSENWTVSGLSAVLR